MPAMVKAHYVRDLALDQLEMALHLYFEGGHWASVVTLAGTADEIFGKVITAAGGENALESLKRAVGEVHKHLYGEETDATIIANHANSAKYRLKHWDAGQPEIIKFDLETEATGMLLRATDNYWTLEHKLTPAMEKFQRDLRGAQ